MILNECALQGEWVPLFKQTQLHFGTVVSTPLKTASFLQLELKTLTGFGIDENTREAAHPHTT